MSNITETPQLNDTVLILRKTLFTVDFFSRIMDMLKNNSDRDNIVCDKSHLSLLYKIMDGDLIINDETLMKNDNKMHVSCPFVTTYLN